jgi:hypothetical protein
VAFVYPAAHQLLSGSWFTSTTLKTMLVDSTYVADRDHVFVSSIGNSEISVSDYTRGFNSPGRKVLSGKTAWLDTTNNRYVYGATNSGRTTLASGAAPVAEVVIMEGTSDSDSRLIAYIDTANPVSGTGGVYAGVWSGGTLFDVTF